VVGSLSWGLGKGKTMGNFQGLQWGTRKKKRKNRKRMTKRYPKAQKMAPATYEVLHMESNECINQVQKGKITQKSR